MNLIKGIDFKSGKITWNTLSDIDINELFGEDLLTIEYGSCLIDVGFYGGPGFFSIYVIKGINSIAETWEKPFARIPCLDINDMLIQLQRAIDIYPGLTK